MKLDDYPYRITRDGKTVALFILEMDRDVCLDAFLDYGLDFDTEDATSEMIRREAP